MGGSQSSETNKEILNDTRVQNSIKKFNETITEQSVSMMQSTMVNAAAGAEVNNKISIKGIKTDGAFVLSDISQKNMVKMNLSVLSKADMKADMVSDMTSKIQSQLANEAESTSDSSNKEGEQILSGIANAVGDTLQGLGQSVTGTDSSSKDNLSIKNLMNVENNTELINKVKNSVTSEMVNESVTNVSMKISAGNEVEIADIEAKDGVVISNLDQENVIDTMMEAVAESGLGNKILSKMMNIDESEIKNAADTAVKNEEETVGTLDAAGEAVKDVGEAASGVIDSGAGALTAGMTAILMPLIIIGVIGVIGLVVLKPLLSKGMDKANVKNGKFSFGGHKGGNPMKNLFKNFKNFKNLQKQLMKYATIDNLIIILSLMVGYKFLPKIIKFIKNKCQKKENFNDDDKEKIIKLKNQKGEYLSQGEKNLEFNDKKKPLHFLLEVLEPGKKIQLSFKDNKDQLRVLALNRKQGMKMVKVKPSKPLKGHLQYHQDGNNFKLRKKQKWIGYNEEQNKFYISKNKNDAFNFYYEFKGEESKEEQEPKSEEESEPESEPES